VSKPATPKASVTATTPPPDINLKR
jgi:hypothetical protein